MSSKVIPIGRAASIDEATDSDGSKADEGRKGWRHQDAVALLRKMILIGDLAPGERLREVAISQKLGMSRTPVREAFRTLAVEGLVELLPNRSVIVSELDVTETADVFLVLSALESLAGQQACARITEDQIRLLAGLQDELERYYGEYEREKYVETNRRIHELIVEGSHNVSLISAWRLVLPRAVRARNANNIDRNRWTEAVVEHRRIFAALSARDAPRLARLINEHFANGSIQIAQKADRADRPAP